MKFEITATTNGKIHKMIFFIWITKGRDRRLLDDDFYAKWSDRKEVPRGLHHEVEVTYINIPKSTNREKIHIHQS